MDDILSAFKGFPSQRIVAKKLLEYGIKVSDGRAYCGDIEQSDVALARSCDVDRRVVKATLEHISNTPSLCCIFSKLKPMLSMEEMARELNCSAIIITPTDAKLPGIIAEITTLLYNQGISLRQATIKDDGQREDSVLNIIVDGIIPENAIMLLKSCRGVASVMIK